MRHAAITRRRFLQTAATAALAVGGPPFVSTSRAAGKLAVALNAHWVPGHDEVSRRLIEDWAKANKVEVTVDYLPAAGDKIYLTAAAEFRAGTGHDVFALANWQVTLYKRRLVPVDEVIAEVTKKHGPYDAGSEYLGKHDGRWHGVPLALSTNNYPMNSRLDLWKKHADVDLQRIFPASPARDKALVDGWTYDRFLAACRKLHAAGHPFANPIGLTNDTGMWLGPLFTSFGAQLVDAKGTITVNSDPVRRVLEFTKELTPVMTPDVYAWDDAGNNRWMLSGKGSGINNPPSVWAVALKDVPEVGREIWHHDNPRGPAGRFRGGSKMLLGIWDFSKNQSAAKDLLLHLSQKEQVYKLVEAGKGYDIPDIASQRDHPVWEQSGPPRGTLYNYPIRGDEVFIIPGYPAPQAIAAQIHSKSTYGRLVARVTQGGEAIPAAIKWAENELEGYLRS
jgi:ABC-type glycerol-3-phosphate transport system substrate-binding protein